MNFRTTQATISKSITQTERQIWWWQKTAMKKFILVLVLILIPTFGLMLRSGIYTMHDFHVFRLQQFEKCLIRQRIFPDGP